MNLFRNQLEYDSFNQKLCKLFDVEYSPIILQNMEYVPMNSMSGEANPFYGQTHNEEIRKIISLANKGKIISDYQKSKIIESNKTRLQTDEFKKKISNLHKGKKKTKKHKINLSIAAKNRVKKKFNCPHCNKIMDKSNIVRWHGDKCKFKEN